MLLSGKNFQKINSRPYAHQLDAVARTVPFSVEGCDALLLFTCPVGNSDSFSNYFYGSGANYLEF